MPTASCGAACTIIATARSSKALAQITSVRQTLASGTYRVRIYDGKNSGLLDLDNNYPESDVERNLCTCRSADLAKHCCGR